MYCKFSKNSISWNIRTPKYPFFNKELKFLVQNFHTQFFKQSIFDASEAMRGNNFKEKKVSPLIFTQFLVEVTWISVIGWPSKTSNKYVNNKAKLGPINKLPFLGPKFPVFESSAFFGLCELKNVFTKMFLNCLKSTHFSRLLIWVLDLCWQTNLIQSNFPGKRAWFLKQKQFYINVR